MYEEIKDFVFAETWARQKFLGAPVEKFPEDDVIREMRSIRIGKHYIYRGEW